MSRYIDADELINKINAYVINSQDVMYIRELIKETPTADVREVVKGEWEVAYIQDFVQYQVDWLTEHDDLELEPELEGWVIRFLQDTASCYSKEYLPYHEADMRGEENGEHD